SRFAPPSLPDALPILLLARVQCKARLFIACEPRRSRLSWLSSCLVGLAGCNAVTRHDAKVSVRAGFKGNELSQLWNSASNWFLRDRKSTRLKSLRHLV